MENAVNEQHCAKIGPVSDADRSREARPRRCWRAGVLTQVARTEGAIRLIEIEGVDLNACGGTHVRSTGQIGGLLIRGTERVKQGSAGRVRMRPARLASGAVGSRAYSAARRRRCRLAASTAGSRGAAAGENKAAKKETAEAL